MLLFLVLGDGNQKVVKSTGQDTGVCDHEKAALLLIRETGNRSRGFGVLLVAVSLMLLVHP